MKTANIFLRFNDCSLFHTCENRASRDLGYVRLVSVSYGSPFFRKYFKTLFAVSVMCKSAT